MTRDDRLFRVDNIESDIRHRAFEIPNLLWLIAEVRRLDAENERLRRGDFAEEEFQNLCHNFDESDLERFGKGFEAYQRKLFGACWKDAEVERLRAGLRGLRDIVSGPGPRWPSLLKRIQELLDEPEAS